MLHLLKYRFIQTVRDYPIMFWALAFPLILGTFFYFSFGSAGLDGTGDYEWDPIKVAIIEEDLSSKRRSTCNASRPKHRIHDVQRPGYKVSLQHFTDSIGGTKTADQQHYNSYHNSLRMTAKPHPYRQDNNNF